jgi:hypothetical protein
MSDEVKPKKRKLETPEPAAPAEAPEPHESPKPKPKQSPCVVIYIQCHGTFVVNDDLTLEMIRPPRHRKITYLKSAHFGRKYLTDFNFSSRYPGGPSTRRHSINDVKQKLEVAYDMMCVDPKLFRNKEEMEKRGSFILRGKGCEFLLGTKKAVCIPESKSNVPFALKKYDIEKEDLRKDEYGHGVFFMLKIDDEFHIFNLTLVKDFNKFKMFLSTLEVEIPESLQEEFDQQISSNNKRYEILNTKMMLDIIDLLPREFTNIKFVDDSCSVLKFRNNHRPNKEQWHAVMAMYEHQMTSELPTRCKGGFRKPLRPKTQKKTKK